MTKTQLGEKLPANTAKAKAYDCVFESDNVRKKENKQEEKYFEKI